MINLNLNETHVGDAGASALDDAVRETRAALEEARATGKRTEALKRFPIGSKVFLRVAFESVGAEEISVNVNDADLEFSGRLVFRSIGFSRLRSEGGDERRVLFEIEAAKLLQKLVLKKQKYR